VFGCIKYIIKPLLHFLAFIQWPATTIYINVMFLLLQHVADLQAGVWENPWMEDEVRFITLHCFTH
jgi:hypothetical protein